MPSAASRAACTPPGGHSPAELSHGPTEPWGNSALGPEKLLPGGGAGSSLLPSGRAWLPQAEGWQLLGGQCLAVQAWESAAARPWLLWTPCEHRLCPDSFLASPPEQQTPTRRAAGALAAWPSLLCLAGKSLPAQGQVSMEGTDHAEGLR